MSKNAAFMAMMALMLLLAIQMFRGQDQPTAVIEYSEFKGYLNADQIDRVTFRDKVVNGEFRRPMTIETREFTRFEMILPTQLLPELLAQLEEQDVVIVGAKTEGGFGQVLLTLLPGSSSPPSGSGSSGRCRGAETARSSSDDRRRR